MNESNNKGWSEYEKLVLSELERHNTLIEHVRKDISLLQTEIAGLKIKSGFWGLLGAAIPIAMAMAFKVIG